MEAVGLGYKDGIRCYDAASGRVKWRRTMPAEGVVVGPVSADLDGDGRDEALYAVGRRLYCIGVGEEAHGGRIKWQIGLPAEVGPPVIADVDGDGTAEILVVGHDGYVYCVDGGLP